MKGCWLFLICIFSSSCLVSRMASPIITGRILDYAGNPIEQCQVGEFLTDKEGYFRIPEKRYHEFTFIGFEAPPVFVNLIVRKEGYESDTIVMYNPFGGAAQKGTVWEAYDIYLKRIGEKIPIKKAIEDIEWEIVYVKEGNELMGFPNVEKENIPPTRKVNNKRELFKYKKEESYSGQRKFYPATSMLFSKNELCFYEYLDEEMTKDTTYYGKYQFVSDSILQIEMNHPKIKGRYRVGEFEKYFFRLKAINK